MPPTVDLSKLRLRFVERERDEDDDEEDYDFEDEEEDFWPQEYRYEILLDTKVIGSLDLLYVDLDAANSEFFLDMDNHSNEASEFAFELFDRNGRLQDKITRQGTRVWKHEVTDNSGSIFYLRELSIKREYRRRGVGRWALNNLFEDLHPEVMLMEYLFTWPAVLSAETTFPAWGFREIAAGQTTDPHAAARQAERDALQLSSIAFFHKAGFRRVGTTRFFCFAREPTHPSRRLRIEDDADLVEPKSDDPRNDEGLTRSEMFGREAGISFR